VTANEVAVRGLHGVLVARVDRVAERARERAHGRAVADVLRALSLGRPDALLLLANVRHTEKDPLRGRIDGTRGLGAGTLPILSPA
jgi:hypothetical protein